MLLRDIYGTRTKHIELVRILSWGINHMLPALVPLKENVLNLVRVHLEFWGYYAKYLHVTINHEPICSVVVKIKGVEKGIGGDWGGFWLVEDLILLNPFEPPWFGVQMNRA
jgi:hypothetical protein